MILTDIWKKCPFSASLVQDIIIYIQYTIIGFLQLQLRFSDFCNSWHDLNFEDLKQSWKVWNGKWPSVSWHDAYHSIWRNEYMWPSLFITSNVGNYIPILPHISYWALVMVPTPRSRPTWHRATQRVTMWQGGRGLWTGCDAFI